MNPTVTLWVALGSMLGSLCRYAIQQGMPAEAGGLIPLGTLSVNVLGSLIIGWFAALTLPQQHPMAALHRRQFVMTGFCGGFTTFSIFSLETLQLIEAGAWVQAWANLGLNGTLALGAVASGFYLGRWQSKTP
ncbi:MAG: fluoride efflux transporter CrcB [Halomonadaceae bacterium]|nr:MAG: fluoride efflux transporter CrcB [Halomonadaceae bacterium]